MNIDPLAEVSRRFSSYAYALDNPVFFIDPDGMRAKPVTVGDMNKGANAPEDSVDGNDEVIIKGGESQRAFTELQSSVQGQFEMTMDSNGKVAYSRNSPSVVSEAGQMLMDAIDDQSITVQVLAENTKETKNGSQYVGGSFGGNTIDQIASHVETLQEINPDVLQKASNYYGTPGADILHEFLESYIGGKIAKGSRFSSGNSNSSNNSYNRAHAATELIAPQSAMYMQNLDSNGNNTGNILHKTGTQTNFVQQDGRDPLIISTYP